MNTDDQTGPLEPGALPDEPESGAADDPSTRGGPRSLVPIAAGLALGAVIALLLPASWVFVAAPGISWLDFVTWRALDLLSVFRMAAPLLKFRVPRLSNRGIGAATQISTSDGTMPALTDTSEKA